MAEETSNRRAALGGCLCVILVLALVGLAVVIGWDRATLRWVSVDHGGVLDSVSPAFTPELRVTLALLAPERPAVLVYQARHWSEEPDGELVVRQGNRLVLLGTCSQGLPAGSWTLYDSSGLLVETVMFQGGVISSVRREQARP